MVARVVVVEIEKRGEEERSRGGKEKRRRGGCGLSSNINDEILDNIISMNPESQSKVLRHPTS